MGKLGVPALAGHALRGDVHGASVIRPLPLETGHCHVDLSVLVPRVGVWGGNEDIRLDFCTLERESALTRARQGGRESKKGGINPLKNVSCLT